MTKKVKKSILRILLGISLLIGSIASVQLLAPPQPIFASMGSTGGGHVSGGGGGGGSHFSPSHTYHSSTDSSDEDDSHTSIWDRVLEGIMTVIACFIVIKSVGGFISSVLQFFIRIIRSLYLRIYIFYQYGGGNIIPAFIKPNIELREFEETLRNYHIQLKRISTTNKYKKFSDAYIKAQFLYSQDLRERYVNKHYSLRNLLEYLDRNYYWIIKNEIKLKVKQATIDDTIVSSAEIVKVSQLGENLWLTQIDARGKDKEVQFDKDFNDSFSRSKWSDYVIFGKDREGKIKIINLVYGEHFHLNGKDFNHQKSLGNGDYKERNL